MTKEELKNEIRSVIDDRPQWSRLGQFVFNYIDEKYGVARTVQYADKVDCYYDDDKIDLFIEKCSELL